MSYRITQKDVRGLFNTFCEVMGFEQFDWQAWEADKNSQIGTYQLDYNSVYGGWYIERIANAGLAISNPFQSYRMKNSEMWYTMHFAIRLKEELDRQEKKNESRCKMD